MRALVTGASGFVGSHLVEHLLEQGDEVVGAVFGEGAVLSCPTVELDVTSGDSCARVLAEVRPDVVYHLAGIASPPAVSHNIAGSLVVNVGGVHAIMSAAVALRTPPRVMIVSSGEVYGKAGSSGVPTTEEIAPSPWNDYALSKVMAEEVADFFHRRRGMSSVVVRPFNHTGPRQSSDFVVPAFARQLARIKGGTQRPVLRVGNLNAQRDFSDVRDVVRAYRLLMASDAQGVYNVASGKTISIQGMLDRLVTLSGLAVRIEQDPERMRPAEVPMSVGSYAKVHRDTGWEPFVSLDETLFSVYQFWLEHETGGEEVVSGAGTTVTLKEMWAAG